MTARCKLSVATGRYADAVRYHSDPFANLGDLVAVGFSSARQLFFASIARVACPVLRILRERRACCDCITFRSIQAEFKMTKETLYR